jgi:hypothetical protein
MKLSIRNRRTICTYLTGGSRSPNAENAKSFGDLNGREVTRVNGSRNRKFRFQDPHYFRDHGVEIDQFPPNGL